MPVTLPPSQSEGSREQANASPGSALPAMPGIGPVLNGMMSPGELDGEAECALQNHRVHTCPFIS